jgi:staphylococcal nuclease domain-containing protein 1
LKLYQVPTTGREYGTVTLPDGRSLIELALEEGMVKLRDDGKREDEPENEATLEKLRLLEANARAEGKGMWGDSQDGRIDSRYEAPEDPVQFLGRYKGKPIEGKDRDITIQSWENCLSNHFFSAAIIERVISGDRVAVRLLLEPKLHQQMVVLIAGIRAPLSKRTDATGAEQAGEEFGDFAKEFVEARLLQRTVKVTLLGLSPQSQFIGNVIHPNGNIAVLVLSQGLARCVDFHSTMIGADMSKFRAAEKTAREQRLKLWKEHVVKAKTSNSNLDAVVSRVLSADTIFVRNKAGNERKINLSSVRQPK